MCLWPVLGMVMNATEVNDKNKCESGNTRAWVEVPLVGIKLLSFNITDSGCATKNAELKKVYRLSKKVNVTAIETESEKNEVSKEIEFMDDGTTAVAVLTFIVAVVVTGIGLSLMVTFIVLIALLCSGWGSCSCQKGGRRGGRRVPL